MESEKTGKIWAKSFKYRNRTAKSFFSLKKHTEDVLKVYRSVYNNRIGDSILDEAIRISIFYHDFGKVLPGFQKKLGNKEYELNDIDLDAPHSLISPFFISEDELKKFDDKLKKFIRSAVAYHHWRFDFEQILFSETIGEVAKKIFESKGELEKILNDEFFNFSEYVQKEIKLDEERLEEVVNGIKFYKLIIPPYLSDFSPLRKSFIQNFEDQKKWIFISGTLQNCDHIASYCEEEGEDIESLEEFKPVSYEEVRKKVEEIIRNKAGDNRIWQLEFIERCRDKNVILIAPTGYGKTEFAFLWGAGHRLIYTLPLRSASNQIFKRACNIFEERMTGLLHSDADIFLYSFQKENSIRSYEFARKFVLPVIVSTGDQIFPYALRPPGYEKVFVNLANARLIVDEIQSYDPEACAIVVSLLEWAYKLGGKFLLMTATLPEYVKKAVLERIPESDLEVINLYETEREKLKKIKRHFIEIRKIDSKEGNFSLPDEEIENILEIARQGKRVLVICNTVKMAQDCYMKLKKSGKEKFIEKVFLIHSQFTFYDRQEKEIEIEREFKNPKPNDEKEGKILVATQVVEASLDIDADVLFTEICPVDSLVQRMGRVLRRYSFQEYEVKEPNVFVWVFQEGEEKESGKGYVYSNKLLVDTEKDLSCCKKISEYEKYQVLGDYVNIDIIEKFDKVLKIVESGFMSDRKEEALKIFRRIYSVSGIPKSRLSEFKEELEKLDRKSVKYLNFKNKVLARFLVQIPNYYESENKIKNSVSKDWYTWLQDYYLIYANYDEDLGVIEKEIFIFL